MAGALGLLLAISGAAWAFRKTHPWLVVGWLWYLGMMVPVIGIVQISYYAHADRYTYLPQIGLYLLLTWAAADLCAGWRHRRLVLGGGATVILGALIFCARDRLLIGEIVNRCGLTRSPARLTTLLANNDLGNALFQKGEVDEAIVPLPKGAANQTRPQREPATTSATLCSKRAGWTKRLPSTKRRCKSTPTARKPTITLATL